MKCPVCFAAKKENYDTHWVRDKKGKVICPTLLNQKCHHCGEKGHTPKYCQALKKEKQKYKRNNYKKAEVFALKSVKVSSMAQNAFSQLDDECEESDSDREEGPVATEETQPPNQQTWSDSVQKSSVEKEDVHENVAVDMVVVPNVTPVAAAIPKRRKLWSEMESDDEDDEW